MIAEDRSSRPESYGTRLNPEATRSREPRSEPSEAFLRSLQAWRSRQPHLARQEQSSDTTDATLEVPVA